MTNAQILTYSLNEWMTPIIEGAMSASRNQMMGIIGSIISPQRLTAALKNNLGVPLLEQYISKVPDAMIPNLALDIIDGMIETRTEQGPLDIPMVGVRLSPDAFRNLKAICESNFTTYKPQSNETDN